MLSFFKRNDKNVATSQLYNEKTFYPNFGHSLTLARKEIIIESPFLTKRRVLALLPLIKRVKARGVNVLINTREPSEHDDIMKYEAEQAIGILMDADVALFFTGKLHRKLAIIDRFTVWEGSLNILSQHDSCEIMRKTKSNSYALQLITFIGIKKYLPE